MDDPLAIFDSTCCNYFDVELRKAILVIFFLMQIWGLKDIIGY